MDKERRSGSSNSQESRLSNVDYDKLMAERQERRNRLRGTNINKDINQPEISRGQQDVNTSSDYNLQAPQSELSMIQKIRQKLADFIQPKSEARRFDILVEQSDQQINSDNTTESRVVNQTPEAPVQVESRPQNVNTSRSRNTVDQSTFQRRSASHNTATHTQENQPRGQRNQTSRPDIQPNNRPTDGTRAHNEPQINVGNEGNGNGGNGGLERFFGAEVPREPREIWEFAYNEIHRMKHDPQEQGGLWSKRISFRSARGNPAGNIIDTLNRTRPDLKNLRVRFEIGGRVIETTFVERLQNWMDAEGMFHRRYHQDDNASPSIKNYENATGFQPLDEYIENMVSPFLASDIEGEGTKGAQALSRAFRAYKRIAEGKRYDGSAGEQNLPNLFTGGISEDQMQQTREIIRQYASQGLGLSPYEGQLVEENALRLAKIWKINSRGDKNMSRVGAPWGDDMAKAEYNIKFRRKALYGRTDGYEVDYLPQAGGPEATAREGVTFDSLLLSFPEMLTIVRDNVTYSLDELIDSGTDLDEIPWSNLPTSVVDINRGRYGYGYKVDMQYLDLLEKTAKLYGKTVSMDIRSETSPNALADLNKLIGTVISDKLVIKQDSPDNKVRLSKIDTKDKEAILKDVLRIWRRSFAYNFVVGLVHIGRTPGAGAVYLGEDEVGVIISNAKQSGITDWGFTPDKLKSPWAGHRLESIRKPEPINVEKTFKREISKLESILR